MLIYKRNCNVETMYHCFGCDASFFKICVHNVLIMLPAKMASARASRDSREMERFVKVMKHKHILLDCIIIQIKCNS